MKKIDLHDPSLRRRALKQLVRLLLVIAGSAVYAVGFRLFLYYNDIVSGGLTGIAMIINYLTGLPIGVMVIIMNVPLFALAWKKLGADFMIWSLLGTVISSVLVDLFAGIDFNVTNDLLLACVFGGIIKGVGWGIVYRAGSTGGGADIVAKLMRQRYPYLNFGTILLILDLVVIAAFAVIFGKYDRAMYSAIAMYISTKAIDFVLYGTVGNKVCYIITDKATAMSEEITAKLHRGVTFLHGEGAYTKTSRDVILCVIKMQQIVELRAIVRRTDLNAFIIISDARDVFGKGFTSITDNS